MVFGEQPSAAKFNILGTNDASFNDGTGIGTGAILSTHLKLTGSQYGHVDTSETTTSTSYTDLATTGPSVSVTINSSGLALVLYGLDIAAAAATNRSFAAIAMTGTNAEVAGTNGNRQLEFVAVDNGFGHVSDAYLATGLSPGSTTFKMQYKVNTGTGTFANRHISVIPF